MMYYMGVEGQTKGRVKQVKKNNYKTQAQNQEKEISALEKQKAFEIGFRLGCKAKLERTESEAAIDIGYKFGRMASKEWDGFLKKQ
jgi:uncharacterized protein (UPF0303 family)